MLSFRAVVALSAVLSVAAVTYPTRLVYKNNQVTSYDLHGFLDARGADVSSGFRSGGSFSTLDGKLVTQVVQQDATSYTFVMNLFNVNVNVGQNASSVSSSEAIKVTAGDEPLGQNAYFQQLFTGEIKKIWYNTQDPEYFVEVKVGAINALQTRLVPNGTQQMVLEADPVGSHLSDIRGVGAQTQLTLMKTFTQNDVQSFTDPSVSQHNIQLTAQTATGISMDGAIVSSTVDQLVNLVDVRHYPDAGQHDPDSGASSTSVDVVMSSKGHLSVMLHSMLAASPLRGLLTTAELDASADYEQSTLFDVASQLIRSTALRKSHLDDVDAAVADYVAAAEKGAADQQAHMLRRLVRYYHLRPDESVALLERALDVALSQAESRSSAAAVVAILHLLARVGTPVAQDVLVQRAVHSAVPDVQLQAVLASYSVEQPRRALVDAIRRLAFGTAESPVARPAMFAYGSLLSRTSELSARVAGAAVLAARLRTAVLRGSIDEATAVLYAIGNAGRKVVSPATIAAVVRQVRHGSVRRAVERALTKFKVGFEDAADATLPFNRTWNDAYSLGGKQVSVTFDAAAFAGTNFDCNQTYFNYEVYGIGSVNVTLFQWTKAAFVAETIYGRANGQPLADEIFVKVWDTVIYDKPLPALNCTSHYLPLGHKQQGMSVEYTLWISVIPVEFSAGATLDLALGVEWSVCDSTLSAEVTLEPTATLTIGGQAQLDLLIIKAGVQLSGSFETLLSPQVYVDGAQCNVGIKASLASKPLSIVLDGYYAVNQCKYWVFDCHWKPTHRQNWLDWSYPAQNTVLFNQKWPIAK